MRICMPIGAPDVPGPVNRLLVAAQGSYTLTGQDAALTYAPVGSFVMPDATNTGDLSGVTRTTYTGPFSISGTATIQNKNINSAIIKTGGGILTIRNCVLAGDGYASIDGDSNTGTIIVEDCNFTSGGNGATNAVAGVNIQVRRCNISGFENGLNLSDGAHQIISNYIHDLNNTSVPDPHIDCIQIFGTSVNGMVIQGNALYGWDTSCILFQSLYGNIDSNALFDNNWYLTQSGRSAPSDKLYIENKNANYNHGSRHTNNWFQSDSTNYVSWGPTGTGAANASVWTGNKLYPSGTSLPLP